MARVTVIATHCFPDGAKTQVVIKADAYPDSLETLQDIADRCIEAFGGAFREVFADDEAEAEAD
jgi:hypothetical protein